MSKLSVAGEAGNVAANLIGDAAKGEGVVADAAQAVQRLLDDAGGAMVSRPKTLSLSGDNLAAAQERLENGGRRVGTVRSGRRGGDVEVFAKPRGFEDQPERPSNVSGGITSWRAPEGAPNPFHGDPIQVTANSGLAGIEGKIAPAVPSDTIQRAGRVPPPPPRELSLKERLPTRAFHEEGEEPEVRTLKDGTVVSHYTTEIPFQFTNSRGTPITSGEWVHTVAQVDAGAMKGWTTLHNPHGIAKIGIGPENGPNYLGQTSPMLDLNFQPKDFANKFSHLEETGAPAFIRDDTTFLTKEANTAEVKPTTIFVNPKNELAGLQWDAPRVMQHGPFTGLKGDEINVFDRQVKLGNRMVDVREMKLIDHSEMVGGKPREFVYNSKALGMENIQTHSEVPIANADKKKAVAIEGVADKVIVPQLLYPRPLMNIVEATKETKPVST